MNFTRHENTFILILIFAILAATFIPYLSGYYHTPPDHVFTWIIPVTNVDVHPWLAMMRQGQEGRLLFSHKYWIEPHSPIIFHPFWLALGNLSQSLKIPLIAAYHGGRILSGFFLLWFLYLFIANFFEQARERRWVFLLTALSSGLGWLQVLGIPMMSIDLWLPDAFVFYPLYGFPHIVFAQALMVLTFMSYLKAVAQKSYLTASLGGICCLFLTLIHPLDGLLVLGVIFLHSLDRFVQDRKISLFTPVSLIVLLTTPAVAYNVYLYALQPVSKIMTSESFFRTPNSLWLMAGYGLLLPLAALGIYWSRKLPHFRLLSLWLLSALILAYLPVPHQRKFLEGSFIPLGILAGYGLFEGLNRWGQRRVYILNKKKAAALILLLITVLGNLYILAADVSAFKNYTYEGYMKNPQAGQPPYLRKEYREAFAWLELYTKRNDIVLSSAHTGNLIPAYAGNRVYLGWWYSIPNSASKHRLVEAFFNDREAGAWREAFLRRQQIKYIFYGPFEKSLGKYETNKSSFLERVFHNSLIDIYQLTGGAKGEGSPAKPPRG